MKRWAVSVALGTTGLLLLPTLASASGANARQLVTAAIQASKSSSSFTVVGSVGEGSQTVGIHVTASNSEAGTGTLTINGGTIQLVRSGSEVYFRANTAFWMKNGGSSAASLFANKWVETAATTSDGTSFGRWLSASALFNHVFGQNPPVGSTLKTVGSTTIAGKPVTVITSKNSRIYVARNGTPYLVRVTAKNGTGSLTFTGYNAVVPVTVPSGAINLDTLG